MVRIISAFQCDCDTCSGGNPAPPGHYGGSVCTCHCHRLRGEERAEFIAHKNKASEKFFNMPNPDKETKP